jgi:hypothetical protein
MTICYGTTRTVVLIHQWAIKVPSFVEWRLFLHGLLANMQEAKFSKTGWPQLCPVLWAIPGGWLLVMRRAEPMSREQFDTFDYAQWIKGGNDLDDGEWVIPVEEKLDSFGYVDGRLVAVDYGS